MTYKPKVKKEKFVVGDHFPRHSKSEIGSIPAPASIASRPESHDSHAPDEVFRANFAENRSLVSDQNPSSKSAGIFPAFVHDKCPKLKAWNQPKNLRNRHLCSKSDGAHQLVHTTKWE